MGFTMRIYSIVVTILFVIIIGFQAIAYFVEKRNLPKEIEELTINQKYNEYILTSLRTIWGCDSNYILKQFGVSYLNDFKRGVEKHVIDNKVHVEDHRYCLTDSGKLFADGIAADLFL